MGDEDFTPATGGFVFMSGDGGEWESLGYVDEGGISLTADSDEEELDRWHETLLSLSEPVSFRIKLPWYMENEWYRIFTVRLRYTVPTLRRGRKGHRKLR